jgi:hypothetical protein
MAKVFRDTSVILCANDAGDPAKQQRAIEVVAEDLNAGQLYTGVTVRHPFA